MNKIQLIFTKRKGSFSVYIENLEKLSVKQIKELQNFVSTRKGIFDFNTYTFVIQKNLEFNEFVSLLHHIGIEAQVQEKIIVQKTTQKIEFGKYKGMLFSEIPDAYLLWLKKNYRGSQRDIIDAELNYRKL